VAVIPGVSDGELIRTSWGDTVADEVNNSVKKTGAQTMTGALTAAALTAHAANAIITLESASSVRYGYIQANVSGNTIDLFADDLDNFRFLVGGSGVVAITAQRLYAGADPFLGLAAGAAVEVGGSVGSARYSNGANLQLFKASSAFTSGGVYAGFYASTNATTLGTITQNGSSAVLYNTSSDYRLKDELGPIEDPVGKLMELQPKHLRWKVDQVEFDGFIAHEVDAVVPYAVTGEKDAVDDGNIVPQQLDAGQLIPLLTAALQEAHSKIDELTARLDALEAA